MWWSRIVLLTGNLKYICSTSLYHVCCDRLRGWLSNTHRALYVVFYIKLVESKLYESLSGIEMK